MPRGTTQRHRNVRATTHDMLDQTQPAGVRAVSPAVYVVPCVRFTRVVRFAPPSQAQHSVGVVG